MSLGLLELLKTASHLLKKREIPFAVAGGIAASFYRERPRTTNDVDLAICVGSFSKSRKSAEEIAKQLKWRTSIGWISNSTNRMKSSVGLIIAHPQPQQLENTVDFLLPSFPWVKDAVVRAKTNLIDYGFHKLPTATVEDIIIAKTFALNIEPERFQDLDDLKSIFCARHDFDVLYLVEQFETFNIQLAKELRKYAPAQLSKLRRRH